MASFLSVLIAFSAHYYGLYLTTPPETCLESPVFTEIVFMLALFNLIWHISMYPKHFRKLHWVPSLIIEVCIAKLLQEIGLNYFWCPFDNFLYGGLPLLLQSLSETIQNRYEFDFPSDVYEIVGGRKLSITLGYTVAFICLACVFQALGVSYKPRLLNLNINVLLDFPCKLLERLRDVFYQNQTRECEFD